MLLGMNYHHGNGAGAFYYPLAEDGTPDVCAMIDADTLELLIPAIEQVETAIRKFFADNPNG